MDRANTLSSLRLSAAASLAAAVLYCGEKQPFVAIDVGCDHAKLALHLVKSGLCSFVVASDVADGPVNKASKTIDGKKVNGVDVSKYIKVVKTDGLCGLENEGANRIFILGMGAEVISGIIERAAFLKSKENVGKICLILQPMTCEDKLRAYLNQNGFCIQDEVLVEDAGRIYSIMRVCYDGVKRSMTKVQQLLGKINIEKKGKLFERQLDRRIRICKKALDERTLGGLESDEFRELLTQMLEIKESLNNDNA